MICYYSLSLLNFKLIQEMGARKKSKFTQEEITGFPFFKRLKYKLGDVIRPNLDPRIVMFSKTEKQVLFLVMLVFVVSVSVFLILELRTIELV